MKEFQLSLDIITSIFDEDVSFQAALKNKFKNSQSLKECRPTVAAITGCVLRHNILFNTLLKDAGEISSEQRYSIYIALANAYFVKRLNDNELIEEVNQRLTPELIDLTKNLLDKKDDPESFIPESINKNSLEYMCIRFNTPEWVLKIWKHFGTSITFKLLRKNLKQSSSYVRVRTSLVELEDVLKDASFMKTSVENILEYKSKEPLRKNGFFVRDELFIEKPGLKYVLDKFSLKSDNSEVFLFTGNSSDSAALEVLETYRDRIGINIGVFKVNDHPAISKTINKGKLKNVNFFEAEPDSMRANISNDQDLVIVYPESTNFDLIRENPDHLLHFKKETMTAILDQQRELLEGCSKFVADQGELLYVVPTVSMKECRGQVVEFLKNHTDFHVVEEKQLFPFDTNQTCLYYALLHKGMPVAKVGIAPTSLINEQQGSTIAQASGCSKN